MDHSLLAVAALFRGTVYDLGCGEAPYRSWLLERAERYVGIDWSDSLHDVRADIVANLNRPLPVNDAVADVVMSISVLEHLSAPESMLGEAYRILKQGGGIVLQTPWQWRIHEAPHDYYRYTPYALRRLLQQAGFDDIVIQSQGGFFSALVLKLNYFSKRFVRGPRSVRVLITFFLGVFWYLGQIVAPALDRLDRDATAEAPAYFVTARKRAATVP